MKALFLILLLCSCASIRNSLPRDETQPSLGRFVVYGAALDIGLQVVKRPLWQRVVADVTVAGVVRYSRCCKRPEAGHMGIMFGASFAEWLELMKVILRR